MGRPFLKIRLLYDLLYYTSSVVISAADPISDLIVALLYLSNENTVFGICTLLVCIIPAILLSALSLQWIIYDTTLESMLKNTSADDKYHAPKDYTLYFMKSGATANGADMQLSVPVDHNEDVVMHEPETMATVEVDTVTPLNSRNRVKRHISEISVDAGLSKYPLIITGTTIDRKHVYKRTCEEMQIPPVKPTWACTQSSAASLVLHLLGLPGVMRYSALFMHSLRIYKKRQKLSSKYEKFVDAASARGIKEVFYNRDLLELYHRRRDAALLRLVEGALEATPQLLLQLYIIVQHTRWETNWFTYLSVVFSFTSVTWSMTSYIYEHRAASYDKGSMTMSSYTVSVVIKFFMCLSRITAILLAATYSGYVVMGVCLAHWLICLIYVCTAKTHFYGGLVWNEWFFKFISSITLILTFMNIVEGNSRVRWIAYHSLILLQNLGMCLYWYFSHYSDPTKPDWYGAMCLGIVVGGMILGALFSLLYYTCLHPSDTQVLEIREIVPVLEQLRKKYTNRCELFETTL